MAKLRSGSKALGVAVDVASQLLFSPRALPVSRRAERERFVLFELELYFRPGGNGISSEKIAADWARSRCSSGVFELKT